MTNFNSYELSPFEIEGQIDLAERCGLIKVYRSDDSRVVLLCDASYGTLSQTEPTPLKIADLDAVLGFVLDIGIKRVRWLTFGGGFFAAQPLTQSQSMRKVAQPDFDGSLFDEIITFLDRYYQSGDVGKEAAAMRANHLLQAYNNARLLYPTFHNESYLGLLRIVDASDEGRGGAVGFGLAAAELSSEVNREVYEKVAAISGYDTRLQIAIEVLDRIQRSPSGRTYLERLSSLDKYGQLTFSCFYSAYRYRSKFVHVGFPFPDTTKDQFAQAEDSGLNYLSPVLGMSHTKRYSPGGLQPGDLLDIHLAVGEKEMAEFKDEYFKLLPTWHFAKRVARAAILRQRKGG